MRRVDAPPAGWYPDPESRTALRWWDGLDWTDARRAPPSQAELVSFERQEAVDAAQRAGGSLGAEALDLAEQATRAHRPDSRAIDEARRATRAEIDLAAQAFAQRAREMRRDMEPLISQYSGQLVRWLKIVATIGVVLLVAYVVFQLVAQASLFDWIGDRIDNVTDQDSAPASIGAHVRAVVLSAATGGS